LVDQARRKTAEKRGGGGRRFELSEADRVIIHDPDTLLSVDETLERLNTDDRRGHDCGPAALLCRAVD
jgi:hypothetical protein